MYINPCYVFLFFGPNIIFPTKGLKKNNFLILTLEKFDFIAQAKVIFYLEILFYTMKDS